MTPIELGPFLMEEPIGEGGMGSVWRATHVDTGLPVAVKVIRGAADDRARLRFRKEVQAHAALSHPGIAYLFEYGQIGESAPGVEGLQQGTPYVAMEFADRGTVQEAMPVDDWATARAMLVQVLDALAYAHARGVIHRDLKPENLLSFETGELHGAARIKLADFGIAHALGTERDTEPTELRLAAGTPQYMSPEQLRGRWREYGPWTDLYALGCIVFELVCGRPPFGGGPVHAIAMKHLTEARPRLEPRFSVPDELEHWIHRAMAIEPQQRFQRAADAKWMLPADVSRASALQPATAERNHDELEARTTLVFAEPSHALTLLAPPICDDVSAWAETAESDALPSVTPRLSAESIGTNARGAGPLLPEQWRADEAAARLPPPLVGTGLGLFGLREPPFVNRHDECGHIWEALRRVVDRDAPQLVLLNGEAGTGKSRIAEWLSARAHELGAATVVRVVHTPSGGPSDGLRAAFEETFRAIKLTRGEVYEHVYERLSGLSSEGPDEVEHHARALTELLRPTDSGVNDGGGPRFRFSNATHRHAFVLRILQLLAARRPLLLWLDDLQWGLDALAMLEHLAHRTDEPHAMLVLATVRGDVVAERPRLHERLRALEHGDWCRSLTVDALDRSHQRELLEGLLPLQEELAEGLAERTEGHPLFAMQLLGHWIEGGDIESGPRGFRIADGREVELPAELHTLWMERIGRLAAHYPEQCRDDVVEALELAAALGREVDQREWREVLVKAEVVVPADLVERLVARGLARPTNTGWSFAHGLLVESVGRNAREGKRWRTHHRECGRFLARAHDAEGATALRIARHLLHAGDDEEALEPILEAIRHLRHTDDIEEAHRFCQIYRDALQRLGIVDADRRAVVGELEYATLLQHEVRLDAVDEVLRRCQERCQSEGAEDLLARTLRLRGVNAQVGSHFGEAVGSTRQALLLYRQLKDPVGIGRSLRSLGAIYKWEGDFESALQHLDEAERHFRTLDEPLETARCLNHLAAVHKDLENLGLAVDYAARARAAFERLGSLWGIADCLNTLGECHSLQDELEEATRFYEAAATFYDRAGMDRQMAPYFNAGLVHMKRGDFERARAYLEEALRRARFEDRPGFLAVGHVGMVANAAGLRRFEEFDEHLVQAERNLQRTTMAERDIPLMCEIAAAEARAAGQSERARRALRLGLEHWERLGASEAVERTRELLARIGDSGELSN